MKLLINGVVALPVLLVAITSLAGPSEGTFCWYRSLGVVLYDARRYFLFCIQTTDYMSTLNTTRTNLRAVVFTHSEIPVLKNSSFVKSSANIELITLHKVGLEEIEDDAFEGLNNLQILTISGNKLEVVKGVWFRNLNNLKMIKLQWNRIKTVEGSFFNNLGYLESLYLSGNNLTCLPNPEFEQIHVADLAINYNPWSEQCLEWIKTVVPRENISTTDLTDLRPVIGEPISNLPDIPINSIDDVCRFVRDHPSPQIQCRD